MMLATDFFALTGITVAVSAVFLRMVNYFAPAIFTGKPASRMVGLLLIFMVGMWLPYGDAGLSLSAFARGILSDMSVSSVILATCFIAQQLGITQRLKDREPNVAFATLALAAVVLYPTALGWGDWDVYRSGWGTASLVAGLSVMALLGVFLGIRLLPWLIAAALTAWAFGLLESGNLWDYLIDPWLALLSIGITLKMGWGWCRRTSLN